MQCQWAFVLLSLLRKRYFLFFNRLQINEYQNDGHFLYVKTIIAGILLVTGVFFLMGCEKYGDAPMTQEMYEYLKQTGGRQAKETDKKLTEIAKHHIPLSTPIKEALKFSTANHFKCRGPQAKEIFTEADAEYGCGLWNITGKHIFTSSNLVFWIGVKQEKVVNLTAQFSLHGQ